MERIEGGGFFAFRKETRERRSNRSQRSNRTGFFSTLERKIEEARKSGRAPAAQPLDLENVEEAEEFLDRIHTLGERLAKERTFTALKEYRAAVQTFLNSVVKNGLAVEEHTSGHSILNRKRYAIIQIVNEKLQRLASGMLQTQKPQLELLRRVEEIYGMLVNLLQ